MQFVPMHLYSKRLNLDFILIVFILFQKFYEIQCFHNLKFYLKINSFVVI